MKNILYPNLLSAVRPIPHSESLLFPFPPSLLKTEYESHDEQILDESSDGNDDYTCKEDDCSSSPFNQNELNDLVRDLYLSRNKAELLGFQLKRKHILSSGITFVWYRHREME
ncbi:UNVERIFIED_CONTAM: hypothetical protein RMT77_000485 [Armadillidium vulgare]